MVKGLLVKFVTRWAVSALGLWIASGILGPHRLNIGDTWLTVILAGFFLALVNMAVKPLLVILSFPAIILSLGLFMLIVNGVVILIASWLYDPFYVSSFGVAVVAGIILALVNYLVTRILEEV